MKLKKTILSTALLIGLSHTLYAEQVSYPNDYRQWTHVKTMTLAKGHALANPFEGIHHIYANNKAIVGLTIGNYEDGAVLVFDLLNYIEKNETGIEGNRKLVGVMQKNSQLFKNTGGWGFEGFAGDSTNKRLTSDGGKSCFDCHASQKNKGLCLVNTETEVYRAIF